MDGKIIGVGFQKTGTSTLREALKILGYKVKDCSPRMLTPILKGNYKKILRTLEPYDAIEDTPWYLIYKELDERIPGSKFILTIRDEESWYNSVSWHIGELRSAIHEWVYGAGKGLPKYDKANTLKVYNNHNKEVLEYFKDRPEDLLVLDFTKGDNRWDELCKFLGKDIPDEPFPYANNRKPHDHSPNRRNKKHRLKFYRKSIKSNIKLKYLRLRGFEV